ncbi:MAG TPA: nucleoside triphosphate pyrophosphohydrolase, partial [Candidatus Limnocylindrales bacterium]|nr:nucleoside triphosphate pyrophosphohydrolase [Candidatus Limnocylindrales bacterium]
LVAEARLRWGLDLVAGLQVIAAEHLVGTPLEPTRPALIVPAAILLIDTAPGAELGAAGDHPAGDDPAGLATVLPGRHGPGGDVPIAVLGRLYPADHPVGRFGAAEGLTIGALSAETLATPLYVRPLAPELAVASPWAMPWISARLRLPDGCPWDREQTHESLRNHLLEEAYEVYDALGAGATPALAEELGDLLLQVVLHAQLAAEEGVFDLTDVNAAIASKIVRRHPHVFGDAEARTASDVNRQWERIKADERADAADHPAGAAGDPETRSVSAPKPPKGALDGVSRILPALAASQEMQERAANIGYEWPNIEGVLDKVVEELAELRDATTAAERAEEYGDLLFVLVNVARWQGIEAEAALRAANDKFRRRFASVERQAAERRVALRDLSFAELDALWDAAKIEEKAAVAAAAKETAR